MKHPKQSSQDHGQSVGPTTDQSPDKSVKQSESTSAKLPKTTVRSGKALPRDPMNFLELKLKKDLYELRKHS